jgi:hypothetical protein
VRGRDEGRRPDGVAAPVQYGPPDRARARAFTCGTASSCRGTAPARRLSELFGCAPSPGALAAAARKTAGLLAPALKAVTGRLIAAEVVHFDETGSARPGGWPGCIPRRQRNSCWSPCTPSAGKTA